MPLRVFLAFLLLSTFARADDDTWSKTVSGLRGRLVIPSAQKSAGDPFVHVYLELQNTLNVPGNLKVRYRLDELVTQATDETGKPLAPATGPSNYDGLSPLPEPLVLPYDGTIRFLINTHGLGVPPGMPRLIDFGPSHAWIIPADTKTYFLSATLTIDPYTGDHPVMAWHGLLELPRVKIPTD